LTFATLTLLGFSAFATTAIGVGYEGAQTNCNIQTLGHGVISNCSYNPNGTVVCLCTAVETPGYTCNTAIGVGYSGVQSNCSIQTGGYGQISNCSSNQNGTVVCSCCSSN
ncbi:MAG: hypothetical protein ACXWQQ_13895, partial [Pseudobdellovibrio sp.]